jgi:hypothetical protein
MERGGHGPTPRHEAWGAGEAHGLARHSRGRQAGQLSWAWPVGPPHAPVEGVKGADVHDLHLGVRSQRRVGPVAAERGSP